MNDYKPYYGIEDEEATAVCEATIPYQASLFEHDSFFRGKGNRLMLGHQVPTGLQPIIKWPGGKEKELRHILPNIPDFEHYYEPFVGGGAVFMGINAKEYYINDFSKELVSLYDYIATLDKRFFKYTEKLDQSWLNATVFFASNPTLVDTYMDYRNGNVTKDELKNKINQFCKGNKTDIDAIIGEEFRSLPCVLLTEMERNLFRKMTRMKMLEQQKQRPLSDKDIRHNIETAVKSAVYMNYRHLYNNKNIVKTNRQLQSALFFFMRNYAYSGMFRYSSKGDFNVPYGGMAYNRKSMAKKLNYYRSPAVQNHFASTHIYNLEFEAFLRETKPTEKDFVFLDPPYDSEFSTYAQNDFTRDDQKRLADYMINVCKAKWMMVIKYTRFIYNLYNKEGIHIKTFDKEYLVSFMNRNDKKVIHLLITNY